MVRREANSLTLLSCHDNKPPLQFYKVSTVSPDKINSSIHSGKKLLNFGFITTVCQQNIIPFSVSVENGLLVKRITSTM